jgi:hypothetical protein
MMHSTFAGVRKFPAEPRQTRLAERHKSTFSPRVSREVCQNVSPSPSRGRGECRMPDAPAASCALLVASMHTSIHSEPPESPGIPARDGLRLIPCSPRRPAFLPPSLRGLIRKLDASVGASGPHVFAVRQLNSMRSSVAPPASTASRPAFVTIASAPLIGTRRREIYS